MQSYQKWIFTGLLTASASWLSATQPDSQNTNDSKVSPPAGQITPPAGPRTDIGARFLLTADFIYWQMQEEGLYSKISEYNSFAGRTQTRTNKYSTPNFKYAPGFKVGAGGIFDYDNWDIFANYTWLKQNHAHGHSLTHDIADPRGGSPTSTVGDENFHAHWTCHFNNVDLELGRQFFISRELVLRPHFGLKGSWINQRLTTLTDSDSDTEHTNASDSAHQDFWGIGLRAGLNTAWDFTRNWSVYGDIAAAELACRFKSRKKEVNIISAPSEDTKTDIILSTRSFYAVRPVLEIALGLRYEMLFSQDRYQFFAQAGWEQQVWWNHNQLIDSSSGDLTLQGLDVKFGFAF